MCHILCLSILLSLFTTVTFGKAYKLWSKFSPALCYVLPFKSNVPVSMYSCPFCLWRYKSYAVSAGKWLKNFVGVCFLHLPGVAVWFFTVRPWRQLFPPGTGNQTSIAYIIILMLFSSSFCSLS
jgi:hypothetical protein